VDVDDDLFGLVDDRHVLVPLESAELRERSQDVWVQILSGRDIAALPAYLGGPVDPLLEEASTRAFGGGSVTALPRGDDDTAMLPPPRDAEFATPHPHARPQVPADYAPVEDSGYGPDTPPDAYPASVPPALPDTDGEHPPILVQADPPPPDDERR
jgi:hypothetical protein